MIAVNSEYTSIYTKETVTVVAINEVKPNDMFYQMMNRYKQHRVMPLVEFIDENNQWHILSLEDFIKGFK